MTSNLSLVSTLINQELEKSSPLLKLIKIGGLQIYIDPAGAELTGENGDFYSRRAGGPFYRWRFEEKSGRWSFSRIHPTILMLRGLCGANWKVVPLALRIRLDEHYIE